MPRFTPSKWGEGDTDINACGAHTFEFKMCVCVCVWKVKRESGRRGQGSRTTKKEEEAFFFSH